MLILPGDLGLLGLLLPPPPRALGCRSAAPAASAPMRLCTASAVLPALRLDLVDCWLPSRSVPPFTAPPIRPEQPAHRLHRLLQPQPRRLQIKVLQEAVTRTRTDWCLSRGRGGERSQPASRSVLVHFPNVYRTLLYALSTVLGVE